MKQVDIMEVLTNAIDKTILGEWKHEGFIGGFTSEDINFEVDHKEYVLRIYEVNEGGHWSDTPTEKVCTGERCPMQVGYNVKNCKDKDCIYRTETEKGGVQE